MFTTPQNQTRQPKGSPTGGQYAAVHRPEADDITLHPGEPAGGTPDYESKNPVADDELLVVAQQVAARELRKRLRPGKHFALGVEDLAQDAVTRSLQARNKNGSVITVAYLTRVTQNLIADYMHEQMGGRETYQARAGFHQLRGEIEQERGRSLTPQETAELAEQFRHDFNATLGGHSRKVRPGYHEQQTRDVYGNDTTFEDSMWGQALLVSGGADSQPDREDTDIEDALEGLYDPSDDHRPLPEGREEATLQVWKLMKAPSPVAGVLSERKTPVVRKTIAEAGGPCTVAREWLNGDDTPATDALFAPFGQLDDSEREKVCTTLTSNPAYSDDLWDNALRTANARNHQNRVRRNAA